MHSRLVVSELPPLQKETEVTNSRVGSQEFSVEGREVKLGGGEFPGVESQLRPGTTEFLLKHGALGGVGGVNGEGYGSTRFRMSEYRDGSKEKIGLVEGNSRTGDQGRDLPGPLRALVKGGRT